MQQKVLTKEIGQRRGGKGMLSWGEAGPLLWARLHLNRPSQSLGRFAACGLGLGLTLYGWTLITGMVRVGNDVRPLVCTAPLITPSFCSLSPHPPLLLGFYTPAHHTGAPGSWTSPGPRGRRKQEGGRVSEKVAELRLCTQKPLGRQEEC